MIGHFSFPAEMKVGLLSHSNPIYQCLNQWASFSVNEKAVDMGRLKLTRLWNAFSAISGPLLEFYIVKFSKHLLVGISCTCNVFFYDDACS